MDSKHLKGKFVPVRKLLLVDALERFFARSCLFGSATGHSLKLGWKCYVKGEELDGDGEVS